MATLASALADSEFPELCVTSSLTFMVLLLPLERRIAFVDTVGVRRLAYFTACGYAWKSGGGSHVVGILTVSSLLRDLDLFPGFEDCLLNFRERDAAGTFPWPRDNAAVVWDACVPLDTGLLSNLPPSTGIPSTSCISEFFNGFFRLNRASSPLFEVRCVRAGFLGAVSPSLVGGSTRAFWLGFGGRILREGLAANDVWIGGSCMNL